MQMKSSAWYCNAYLFALIELSAFLLPGVLAVMGYPRTCLALLLAYWVGHLAGGNAWYKHDVKEKACGA